MIPRGRQQNSFYSLRKIITVKTPALYPDDPKRAFLDSREAFT
jgi:hypothetical protein